MGINPIMVAVLVIGAVLIIGVFVVIVLGVVRLLQANTLSTGAKVSIALVLILVTVAGIGMTGLGVHRLSQTPPAQAIADDLDLVDLSGQLRVRGLRMPAPDYVIGVGSIEKRHVSTVMVDVANDSSGEIYLGLEYYTRSGSIGPYSPGATWGAEFVTVPANWTGALQFPIRHLRFVAGGHVRITLAKCKIAQPQSLFLPPDAEQLFEKKYVMVAEQSPSKEILESDQ
jgi:hypothetical protein